MRLIDKTGHKYGRFLVIKRVENTKFNKANWLCQCDCGGPNSLKVIMGCHLSSGRTISCGCYKKEQTHKRCYTGTKDISGAYFCNLMNGAKSRGIEFALTILYIQELLETQGYKCALSGIDIYGSINNNKKFTTYSEQTASLDRIDSSKGYVEGNVQWVHKDINMMKQDHSDKSFIDWCNLVANHNKKSRVTKCYKYEKKAI